MTPPASPADTQGRILEHALGLFLRYGAKAVTMDMLASELGISKKTIYQYYPDKDALVLAGCQFHIEHRDCLMHETTSKIEDPLEEFMEVSRQLRQQIQGMNPTLLFDLKRFYPAAWAEVERHKQEDVKGYILSNFERGIAAGYYRPDFDQRVLMTLKMEQYTMALDPTLFPPNHFLVGDVFDALTDHFIRGILTPKGCEWYDKLLQAASSSPQS